MSEFGWRARGGQWDEAAVAADPVGATQRTLVARRRQRRWIVGLWVLAGVVVALAVVTVAVTVARSHSSSTAGGSGGAGAAAATTSSTTTSLPSGSGPLITALSPAQAAVGQVVVITGSGLVSTDGQVIVHFGDVGAPTSCSSATTCQATVPTPTGGAPKVEVTVSTASGTSNPLPFTYQ